MTILPTKELVSKINYCQIRCEKCRKCEKTFYYLHKEEIKASTTGIIFLFKDRKLQEIVDNRLIKKLKISLSKIDSEIFCPNCFRHPMRFNLFRLIRSFLNFLIAGIIIGGGISAWTIPFTSLNTNNIIYYMIYASVAVTLILIILFYIKDKPKLISKERALLESMTEDEFKKFISKNSSPIFNWMEEIKISNNLDISIEKFLNLGINDKKYVSDSLYLTADAIEILEKNGLKTKESNKIYFGFL